MLAYRLHSSQKGRTLAFFFGFCRSVHNVRIERLWVDISKQLGWKWKRFFEELEFHHGFDPDNPLHIWLLHTLFLPLINDEIEFFVQNWNQHCLQIRGEPSRSPIGVFEFDMLLCGVRGTPMDPEAGRRDALVHDDSQGAEFDLETYGVDWQALSNRDVTQSQLQNNGPTEPISSWIGRRGPPPNMNSVEVETPDVSYEVDSLWSRVGHLYCDPVRRVELWTESLVWRRASHAGF